MFKTTTYCSSLGYGATTNQASNVTCAIFCCPLKCIFHPQIMHHTQQLLPSVWVPNRWTDLPFPGFNGWQHIGCSWCVNECQGEWLMDVDGICPVQSDNLEHKPAPLQSLADLGKILIFNLKVSGILGGFVYCIPDLFITTWSFRSVEVAYRLPGFQVGGEKNKFYFNGL